MFHQLVELKRALTLAGLQLSLSLVWKVAGAVAAELGLELGEVWEDSVSSALWLAESGLDAPRPVVSGAVGLHLVAVAVRELPAPEAFAQQGLPCAVQSLASKRITSCWFSRRFGAGKELAAIPGTSFASVGARSSSQATAIP